MSTDKKKPDQKPDQKPTHLDLEVDRSKAEIDSVIDECVGDPNAFETIIDATRALLHDLQDGEQDNPDEHYQAIDASMFSLDSADEMTKGDQTDQMLRRKSELEQMKGQESSTGKPIESSYAPIDLSDSSENDVVEVSGRDSVELEPGVDELEPGVDELEPGVDELEPGVDELEPGVDEHGGILDSNGDGEFNIASATSDFGTSGAVNIKFLAQGARHDIEVVVTKSDHNNASGPTIVAELYGTTVVVDLNTNAGNETTAALLIDAINNHAGASALIRASLLEGDGATDITVSAIDYSPIALLHLEQKPIELVDKGKGERTLVDTSTGEWSLCASLIFFAAYLVVLMFWALGHPLWETIISCDLEVYRTEFPIGIATILLLISVLSAFCAFIGIVADRNNRRTLLVRLLSIGPVLPTATAAVMIWIIIQRGAGNSILESFLG